MTPAVILGGLAVAVWLYLLIGRGGFWLARERDGGEGGFQAAHWPSVVAVMPARNEADVIAQSVQSLLRQDYAGSFRIVLVDDGSTDGTAETAARAAEALDMRDRLEVLAGAALPSGWTGKLWALQQGVQHVALSGARPDYILLTDADIGHAPDNVRSLVVRAEREQRVLVSLMAELFCRSWAESFLIPAFVFFFQMLYPFRWVAQRRRRTAAAAGGCVLVRREALERAGGIAAVRSEIIDDCALARRLKGQGAIWLGLTRRARSLRPYGGFAEIGRMVSRSAYAQLDYSPLLLLGTVVGMGWIYLAPPAITFLATGPARWLGLAAWLAMALALQPMLRFYRVSPLWGLAMPAIAFVYALFTINSALQVWRGRGGMWKGRAQAMTGGT
ncbi:glycosyltransferase [Enhydrobacter sp.]|jgi:hopene-associated glycosyltransferase HpnB|uniref:glycosyltransferase n=1 Tax=Enhydrobacter sp. TaxID=1894999 RepID=UPI0026296702|nr:glycosyltransferase [Enhydrobacter sp.]WIM10242.1 MAG: Hopene-associated glycosyltransferase HpnB [Enhydrobacter sp.]